LTLTCPECGWELHDIPMIASASGNSEAVCSKCFKWFKVTKEGKAVK